MGDTIGETIDIAPSEIDATRRFSNAFNKSEAESVAHWIVVLAQLRGKWESFTADEVCDLAYMVEHSYATDNDERVRSDRQKTLTFGLELLAEMRLLRRIGSRRVVYSTHSVSHPTFCPTEVFVLRCRDAAGKSTTPWDVWG